MVIEALEDPDCELWLGVSNEEFSSLKKNQTSVLVDSVKNQKPIGCKWVYRGKAGIEGVKDLRFKTRYRRRE